jgi:RNA polymerase sigma factor (sigma-70 family)
MKIGAKINIFNAELREARKRRAMSQWDLAEATGEAIATIQFIETLQQPTIRFERMKDVLQKIADILDVDFDVLFPNDYLFALQNKFLSKKRNLIIYRDIDILSLPPNTELLQLPAPDEIVETRQMEKTINEILETLPAKEQQMIKYYYGFTDGNKHSFEETGKVFGATGERVRQICETALSRMRNPSIRNTISNYLHD